MTNAQRIILASGSAIRADILRGAGVPFDQEKPDVDEDALKRDARAQGLDLEETALMLAEAKALAVRDDPAALVIGSDQILEFEGLAFDKPGSLDEAKERLSVMQGAAHSLVNAVAVARGGEVLWRVVDRPKLFMRPLSEPEIDAYIAAAGEEILKSVGAYQVEKLGARLFERIEGDYTAVLGMSLFPLIAFLRREGVLEY